MFKRVSAAVLATTATALAVAPEPASAATVHVRVEGLQRTVFNGVVDTGPRTVRAKSDTEPRLCDGTNSDRNPVPGATATGATATAMESHGQTFDGNWTPGYDDYFITEFGGDREDTNEGWWWGVLINKRFIPVGGCQYQVTDGDEVLWVNDAFSKRSLLWLTQDTSGNAVVGQPHTVFVGGSVPAVPEGDEIGVEEPKKPYAGATVSEVDLTGNIMAAPTVSAALTNGAGAASLTFTQPGWHRVKARHQVGADHPLAIASNSIDVCVRASSSAPTCDGPPPSQVPATPGHGGGDSGTGGNDGSGDTGGDSSGGGSDTGGDAGISGTPGPIQLEVPAPPVLLPGSDQQNKPNTSSTRKLIRIDDRARGVKRTGKWKRKTDKRAANGSYSVGFRGARLRVRITAGKPVVFVRGIRKAATIELRIGKQKKRFRIKGSKTTKTRQITWKRKVKAGTLTVRVLKGSVGIDGVAAG